MRATAWTRIAVSAAIALLASAAGAQAAPTTAPASVHVTATTATQFSLAWDAPSEPGTTSATITASAPKSTYRPDFETATAATLTSGDVGSLNCGTTYQIGVYFSDGSSSGPRTTLTATTSACTKPTAAAPSGLTGTALSAGSIRASWDDSADPAAAGIAYSLVGPLAETSAMPLFKRSYATTLDLERLVCGETYTLNIGWVNDEGGLSPLSSAQMKTLDCSTLGAPRPGPAGVKITRAYLTEFVVEFDPQPSDVIGYRLSASGPNADASAFENKFFASGDTFNAIKFAATCGETYTISVQWVFTDGGISQPTSASGPAPTCPAPAPEIPAPRVVPHDTLPPVVTIARTRFKVNKKGALVISLSCGSGEAHCSGTLTLRAGKNGKRVRLPAVCGHASFRVAGGSSRTITIALRRSALAALKRAKSAQFVLAIAAQDDSANKAAGKVILRVLAPAKRT